MKAPKIRGPFIIRINDVHDQEMLKLRNFTFEMNHLRNPYVIIL